MDRLIRLPLYGEIPHGPADRLAWNCYQTDALARLRDISLSSTPSRFMPHGQPASRFQHTVGVGYLARCLCERKAAFAPYRDLLVAAALCHDAGSPPFSHIAELFFFDLTGTTHEQATVRTLAPGSELAELLAAHEVAAEEVIACVTGEHPLLGPLVAGSVDLDNADNSLTLLLSLGLPAEKLPYHPLGLIDAFDLRDGQVCLDAAYVRELLGWNAARRELYTLLAADPVLAGSAMLYRALEFAYADGALDDEFFALTEGEALAHLTRACGPEPAALIGQAASWRQYPPVFTHTSATEDPRLVGLYADWRARKVFADALAEDLGVPAHELAVYVARRRGEKPITLPFFGDRAEEVAALFARRDSTQHLAVFTHKRHALAPVRVAEAVWGLVHELPAAGEPVHVFW